MSISFACPRCGKHFKVREELAGKRAKCSCGNVLKIPDPAQLPPAETGPNASFADWLDEEAKPPAPSRHRDPDRKGPDREAGEDYQVAEPELPRVTPRPSVSEATKRSDDDEGGGAMSWIVFILIFGVGNAILYYFTGWVIIPIPRK